MFFFWGCCKVKIVFIWFLIKMVLSIEDNVFFVIYIFMLGVMRKLNGMIWKKVL